MRQVGRWMTILLIMSCAGDGTGLDQNGRPTTAETVEVSRAELALPVAGTAQLSAQFRDANGAIVPGAVITWQSVNPAVATVDGSGEVTAVGAGSTMVQALSGEAVTDVAVDVVTSASFQTDVQPIFTNNCAFTNCHAGPLPQMNQNLSDGVAYANIVGVPSGEVPSLSRIEPGEPMLSYLVHKIRGTQLSVGGTGQRMPLGSGPLSDADINVIRAWVQVGAPQN